MFNSDIKGIIFLGMLLVNCFITIMVGNVLPADTIPDGSGNSFGVCQSLTLTRTGPLSKNLPLNINVFAFTFAYLAQIIEKYGLINTNIPTVIVFSSIILYQWYWSWVNNCTSLFYSFVSLALGFGFGWLFSFCVDQMGITDLQYFNGLSQNTQVCKRAKKQIFKCSRTQV